MTQQSNPLPRTRAALERLAEAIAGLEHSANQSNQVKAKLAADLAAIKSEKEALQQVVDSVSSRLDGAIERVAALLEG